MTIDQAAANLWDRFHHKRWFVSVGIGKHEERDCIIVFVTSVHAVKKETIPTKVEDFEVRVQRFGSFAPMAM